MSRRQHPTVSIDELSARVAARGGPHAPYNPDHLVTRDLLREERDQARRANGITAPRTTVHARQTRAVR